MEERATRIATVPPPPIPIGGVRLPWYAVALGVVLIVASALTCMILIRMAPGLLVHGPPRSIHEVPDIALCAGLLGMHIWRLVATIAFLRRRPRSHGRLRLAVLFTWVCGAVTTAKAMIASPLGNDIVAIATYAVMGMLMLGAITLLVATSIITRRPEVVRVLEP